MVKCGRDETFRREREGHFRAREDLPCRLSGSVLALKGGSGAPGKDIFRREETFPVADVSTAGGSDALESATRENTQEMT